MCITCASLLKVCASCPSKVMHKVMHKQISMAKCSGEHFCYGEYSYQISDRSEHFKFFDDVMAAATPCSAPIMSIHLFSKSMHQSLSVCKFLAQSDYFKNFDDIITATPCPAPMNSVSRFSESSYYGDHRW